MCIRDRLLADCGVKATTVILDELREQVKKQNLRYAGQARQALMDHGGGLHAAVRQEQSILQLLIEILVDLPIFPGNFVHLFGEVSPGFTQARKQAGK